jgi:16S rRNA processing protein RimM
MAATGPSGPARPSHLAIGYIGRAHGVRGEVVVAVLTDFPERLAPGADVLVGTQPQPRSQVPALRPARIESSRPHKDRLLVKLDIAADRSAAEGLRGCSLYVAAVDAVDLEEGTYWEHDVLGLRVVTSQGRELGRIEEIIYTGSNDVYKVVNQSGDVMMIPALEDVIRQIDIQAGGMVVELMEGLE